MNTAGYISLALTLLNAVLPNVKGAEVEASIAQNIQSAIDSLMKVHGSDVTYSQLESLRVKNTF